MHFDYATLETGLDEIHRSPADAGSVVMIVRRPAENEREILEEARLDVAAGLTGDRWLHGPAVPGRQLTLMNARAVALVAGTRDRWPLAGDQLYVDLDLSAANLPVGTRLAVGSAVVEVSVEPHRGCKKFAARFGVDALRFVNSPEGYALRLRGINVRVVRGGVVRPGDTVRKLPVPDEGPAAARESAPDPATARESAPDPATARESAPDPATARESAPDPATA